MYKCRCTEEYTTNRRSHEIIHCGYRVRRFLLFMFIYASLVRQMQKESATLILLASQALNLFCKNPENHLTST